MNDTPGNSSPVSEFERAPLRIAHLLMWIACSAVYLGILIVLLPKSDWARNAMLLAFGSFSAGGGILGLVLLHRPNCRGELAAGELLLRFVGLYYLLMIGALLQDSLSSRIPHASLLSHFEQSLVYKRLFVVIVVIVGAFYAWSVLLWAVMHAREWRWRLLFGVLFVLPLGWHFAKEHDNPAYDVFFEPVAGLMITGILAAAAYLDCYQPIRRAWTHWAGLLCCGWASLTMFIVGVITLKW